MADGWKKNLEVLLEQWDAAAVAIKADLANAAKYWRCKRYWKGLHTFIFGPPAEIYQHMHRWVFYRDIIFVVIVVLVLAGCSAVPICNSASDARCVGEAVGSECTTNRSHTCIKTGGGALRPDCDCLDSQGGPVPDDYHLEELY